MKKYDLIFGTTGSGKSTLAEQYPDSYVDGDGLLQWPDRDMWWDSPTAEDVKLVSGHIDRLLDMARTESRTILYCPSSSALAISYPRLRRSKIAILNVNHRDLIRNMKSREQDTIAIREKYGDAARTQPIDVDHAMSHQKKLDVMFPDSDILTINDLEKLARE
jgi:DNA polymerase III delta prime subunit